MANEVYYKGPHCMGKATIVLKENGHLVLLRRARSDGERGLRIPDTLKTSKAAHARPMEKRI